MGDVQQLLKRTASLVLRPQAISPTGDIRLKRAWYRIALDRELLRKKGNAFQDFFGDIMEKRFPEDFIRVRPWGKVGDRKNDGYLRSERILFQVYAPNEMSAAAAVAKIEEDFHDALPYWKKHFDTWIFVHNSVDGLGPQVTEKLLALDKANPSITVTSWGFETVGKVALTLHEEDLITLLGGIIAPTDSEIRDVTYENIKCVLMSIERQSQMPDADIRPVPPEKLAKSGLSDDTSYLLTIGMMKSDRVSKFLANWPDPEFGNQVVESFHREYQLLRDSLMTPDAIFQNLLIFSGGLEDHASPRRGAVLAVLAYLFEECEIFERPEEKSK